MSAAVLTHAMTPPDTIKLELQQLMSQAVESDDLAEMERIYHLIVSKSNTLRQQYNLPEDVEQMINASCLKSMTEQLQCAGVGHEAVLGDAVYAKATAPRISRGEESMCLFNMCFQDEKKAQDHHAKVLEAVKRHTPMKAVKIYMPLLLRSQNNGVVLLHINAQRHIMAPQGSSLPVNAALICFEDEPIVPVLDKADHARFRPLVQSLYSLKGYHTAEELKMALIR